jgi:predicted phosphodiesterase
MRLVAMADTHLFHEDDDFPVPDGDVLIHAGDLCRGGSLQELERAAAWLRALPHRHKIVVAGNHDRAFEASDFAHARALFAGWAEYLEDAETKIDGVRFYGSPWQPEFHAWAFNLPRGAPLADKWKMIPADTDVLITHGPPRGFGDRATMPNRLGCDDLLTRVRAVKPSVHLFGHIHEDGGAWDDDGTWLVNCTTWECERAPTIVDLDDGAVRVSAPPSGRSSP